MAPLTFPALQTPPILPIDITGLIAIIMGISIVLIPVIGFTARFVLKPFAEALAKYSEHQEAHETTKILERRVALLEQQLESVEHTVARIAEVQEFHHELEAGAEE